MHAQACSTCSSTSLPMRFFFFRVSSCWVFIAFSHRTSAQQSVLQSTTFRPGCPSHFQVKATKNFFSFRFSQVSWQKTSTALEEVELQNFRLNTVRIGYRVTGYNDLLDIMIGLTKIKIKTSKRHSEHHYMYIQCISAVVIYRIQSVLVSM